MKKLASVFLTGVLCLSLAGSAFAWGGSGGGHSGGGSHSGGSSSGSSSGWSGGGSHSDGDSGWSGGSNSGSYGSRGGSNSGGYQGNDNHNSNSNWGSDMHMNQNNNWGNNNQGNWNSGQANPNNQNQSGQHSGDRKGHFNDMRDAMWAAPYIMKMQNTDMVKGYPDGSFKPNQSVNRAEAISLIARSQNANQVTGQSTYVDAPAWAANHINWAVNQQLLTPGTDGNKLSPEKPATRLWVAQMAVRLLGLEDQAAAAQTANLTFKDSSAIPADMQGYVKIAMEKGIFAGYPDQTFQPNKPISRAEMCVILDRCLNQMNGNMMLDNNMMNNSQVGTLSSVENGSITVTLTNGDTKTLSVAESVYVWVNNAPATINDIKAGDVVQVALDAAGNVIMIDAVSNQQTAPATTAPADTTTPATTTPADTTTPATTTPADTTTPATTTPADTTTPATTTPADTTTPATTTPADTTTPATTTPAQ